ncbi:MAG: hypothetical protein HC802_10490 [Caldilineaceae bacterium]|nr:hypothetical protein [Caldilineaceae bacterium]
MHFTVDQLDAFVVLSPHSVWMPHRQDQGTPNIGEGATKSSFRLGYVTDVEGNIDYFVRYVVQSKVLQISHFNDKSLVLDFQSPNNGNGEIYLFTAVMLWTRDRVTFGWCVPWWI